MTFVVLQINIDGATRTKRFGTAEEAIAYVDGLQAEHDAGGNPLGYRYAVLGSAGRFGPLCSADAEVYRTRPHHGLAEDARLIAALRGDQ